jgi:hypothetical protein
MTTFCESLSTMTDHEDSELPGLDEVAIRSLSDEWGDGGLWTDIGYLAERFWSEPDGPDRLLAWHHLVLAVGNFKRQGGTRLRPASLGSLERPLGAAERPSEFLVPGTDPPASVGVEEERSWALLKQVLPGAGVATTTTLLAALWPGRHFVFDRLVYRAAIGLRLTSGLNVPGVEPTSSHGVEETFLAYAVVREWVLSTAASTRTSVESVERCLYLLAQPIKDVDGRSWLDYGSEIRSHLLSVP